MPAKLKSSPKHQLFAACAPGLEPFLLDEFKQLHVGNTRAEDGGVSFTGNDETIARVNLQSRIADRILLRLGNFSASHLSEFEKKAATLPFDVFIPDTATVTVNASCKKSKIYHSGAAAERLAIAIARKINLKSSPRSQVAPDFTDSSTIAIQVRVIRDDVTVSVDTSGEHLHKRGYRTHVTEAPLRENVAAAALRFCGYTGDIPLSNPMCGSGTIAIEAALIATRTAPGLRRHFAFEQWPSFGHALLESERTRAQNYIRVSDGIIAGSDIAPSAIAAATRNVHSAKLEKLISLKTSAISQLSLSESPGLLVVNPPWGVRLNNVSVQKIYQEIGNLARQHPQWQLCLITSDARLAMKTGMEFSDISAPIPMGGIRIKFYKTKKS